MRILIDENLPYVFLSRVLSAHETASVKEVGWEGIKNGELLRRIEGVYDAFMTADKGIRHQQNLQNRTFAIVEFYTNRRPLLAQIPMRIREAVDGISGSEYIEIGP